MASSSFNYTQLITALFSLGLIIIETKSWPSSEFASLLLSFKQQLIQRCEWVMTPMTWLMRKNLAWRITCYMHCTLSTILNNHIWVVFDYFGLSNWRQFVTKCQWDIRPINLQIKNLNSQNCAGHKGRKKSTKIWVTHLYSDYLRLKSCIPIPKVLEELKLGCDPLLAAKKSDLWFYLTGLLQQFIKTNKSNFNCKEQCSFCTFLSWYQSSFFSFQFSWP